ncbi:pleckstrin homology-like domain family A member 1 [Ambystoma mexicanum]|uniref:pleckstrin homology-like domain family A member 1 n=1 Tax=Ambystoma mexicanum TaxID=8296 RepID=UPI0037E94CD9
MLEGGCKVVKEGLLEKRSDGLLQLWKKKRCLLTEEGLLLVPPKLPEVPPPPGSESPPPPRVKQLHFSHMKTVDCVERKGKYVYFTVVMSGGREVDFRGPQEQGWNAEITLQMVQYKNRQAILAVKSTRHKQQHLAQQQPGPPALPSQPQPPPQPRGGLRARSASNSA